MTNHRYGFAVEQSNGASHRSRPYVVPGAEYVENPMKRLAEFDRDNSYGDQPHRVALAHGNLAFFRDNYCTS